MDVRHGCTYNELSSLFTVLVVGLAMSGCPPNGGHVDRETRPLELRRFDVILDQFGRDANHVLTLPVLDHVHRLQRRDDVALGDACHVAKRKERNNRWILRASR